MNEFLLTKEEIDAVVAANFYPHQMYLRHQALIKAQAKKLAEWLKTKAWQGHKSVVGFDPPKGYLVREDEVEALLKDIEDG